MSAAACIAFIAVLAACALVWLLSIQLLVPHDATIRNLVGATANYTVPRSAVLEYSSHDWGSLGLFGSAGNRPRTLCAVFKFGPRRFDGLQTVRVSGAQKEKGCGRHAWPKPEDGACRSLFRDQPETAARLSVRPYASYRRAGRGARIFTNTESRTVAFDLYIYE